MPNGDVYTGTMSGGKMVGWGTLKYTDGRVFEGFFVDGKPSNGKLT